MSAIRLARAATGRKIVIKFEGCYHGHADSFLSQAGSGLATLGIAAAITADQAERNAWLAEGEALLAKPTLSHIHLFFRRYAIVAALVAGQPAEARRHATALASHAAAEPMPDVPLVPLTTK